MLLQNILKTLWALLGAVLQATRIYTIRSMGRARKPGQPHSTGNLGSFHKWLHRAAGSWVHHLSSVTVRSVQKEKHHPGPLFIRDKRTTKARPCSYKRAGTHNHLKSYSFPDTGDLGSDLLNPDHCTMLCESPSVRPAATEEKSTTRSLNVHGVNRAQTETWQWGVTS